MSPQTPSLPRACIDGTGPGWRALGEDDFVPVNCNPETWTWKDGVVHCTGRPVGVIRTRKTVTNFELVAQWRHLQSGGNSGIFVWAPEKALEGIKPGRLPRGRDRGPGPRPRLRRAVREAARQEGRLVHHQRRRLPGRHLEDDAVPAVSPDGSRSFPRKQLSKGVGQWNHYYVRGINGEIRLWVNGEEVSGGSNCKPGSGYLCLESEGRAGRVPRATHPRAALTALIADRGLNIEDSILNIQD